MLNKAIKHYIKVTELVPFCENVYYNLGIAYLQKGELEKAIEYLTRGKLYLK